ncbi:MAG TPA: NYN domain-containing protein [Gemmatimonadales bacterium]|nr:NYN domain-containing protein [Gemmatimonadales bacterium]
MTPASLKAGRPAERPVHAPNAALLIDFDNVTLGIRSDLTKELRTLLNSDMIKGKVAVQRAYADWRRYPQYIVPLSESSIDLIFAPAFGTAKKNATDIRLAIDAIELVFTRPEIGTVILLSGDSDFSSLVIKLKEYGKYVIGVGIRESASDLLIQNCDEYYSYSDLAGLTREVDTPSIQRDPWELVVEAVQRMSQHADVMRSDRLKQVMQQIDQNFDEKNAGFNRFSKFVQEAANRGLVAVTKLENGQFEVAPAAGRAPGRAASPPAPVRDGERGRGRGRGRPPREAPPPAAAAPAPLPVEPAVEAAGENGERRGRRRRGRGRGGREEAVAPIAAAAASVGLTLARAFELMGDALAELPTPAAHEALRLRMVALHGRDDELLQPHRFPRLLRQAHDAEVADVHKVGDDEYEVAPHAFQGGIRVEPAARAEPPAAAAGDGGVALVAPPAPVEPTGTRAMLRFRRGSAGPGAKSPAAIPMVGVVKVASPVPAPVKAEVPAGEAPAPAPATKPRGRRGSARPAAPEAATDAPKKPRAAKKPARPAAKRAKKAASTAKE